MINGSISNIFLLVIVNIMAYNRCNAIILNIDADITAAEAHGMAAGLLCVNPQTDSELWLAELVANSQSMPISDENESLLIRLFEQTKHLLLNNEFEFDLFLPDDEASLIERVDALKYWCRGFLFGVGSSASTSNCSKEVLEILKDITEFTKLDSHVEGEDDENALMEITEYLRSALLLVRDEMTYINNETSD